MRQIPAEENYKIAEIQAEKLRPTAETSEHSRPRIKNELIVAFYDGGNVAETV